MEPKIFSKNILEPLNSQKKFLEPKILEPKNRPKKFLGPEISAKNPYFNPNFRDEKGTYFFTNFWLRSLFSGISSLEFFFSELNFNQNFLSLHLLVRIFGWKFSLRKVLASKFFLSRHFFSGVDFLPYFFPPYFRPEIFSLQNFSSGNSDPEFSPRIFNRDLWLEFFFQEFFTRIPRSEFLVQNFRNFP